MTKQEAMERFGVTSENDICKENVMRLLEIAKEHLNVWSLTFNEKDKLSKDCEAYLALLK